MGGLVCAVHRRKNKGFPTLKRTLNLGIEKGRLLKNSRPKGGLIQVICYPASPETVDITGFFEKFCIAIRTMVVVGIYAVLIQQIGTADDISGAIWGCMGYTVLLCFCLFKTGSISKAVFNAS